jgi:hypothetical protein
MTRRQLLRRGVIVGGTLIWTIPVLNSLTPQSFAATSSPASFTCCLCQRRKKPRGFKYECIDPPAPQPKTAAACADACKARGYPNSQFFSGPNPFTCTDRANGCVASQ